MKKHPLIKIIDFPLSDTKNGTLTMFQYANDPKSKLPFLPKKILIIQDMKNEDTRGAHTHHRTRQILVPISGGCLIRLDDGNEKCEVEINKTNEGILLEPYVWHSMENFKPGTILLVIADTVYDETEYIRNYEEFLRVRPNKKS